MTLCGYNTVLGNFSTEVIVFLCLKVIGDLLLLDSGFKMMGLTKILVKCREEIILLRGQEEKDKIIFFYHLISLTYLITGYK